MTGIEQKARLESNKGKISMVFELTELGEKWAKLAPLLQKALSSPDELASLLTSKNRLEQARERFGEEIDRATFLAYSDINLDDKTMYGHAGKVVYAEEAKAIANKLLGKERQP